MSLAFIFPGQGSQTVGMGAELAEAFAAARAVFEEVDDALGEKLAALGQSHQVICVTHLPQVASYARHQWTIRKGKRGKRVTTTIALQPRQRRRG